MTTLFAHPSRRTTARLTLAGFALLVAAQGAAAAENGVQQWFSAMFGDAAQPAAATPAQSRGDGGARPRRRHADAVQPRRIWAKPLTVRLHHAAPRSMVAQVPTKPGKVSIYQDHTLRPGDAVMMADGLRVFAGSKSWPYRATDFRSLDGGKRFGRETSRFFAALDRVPRN